MVSSLVNSDMPNQRHLLEDSISILLMTRSLHFKPVTIKERVIKVFGVLLLQLFPFLAVRILKKELIILFCSLCMRWSRNLFRYLIYLNFIGLLRFLNKRITPFTVGDSSLYQSHSHS